MSTHQTGYLVRCYTPQDMRVAPLWAGRGSMLYTVDWRRRRVFRSRKAAEAHAEICQLHGFPDAGVTRLHRRSVHRAPDWALTIADSEQDARDLDELARAAASSGG